jgi:hypothetical protein
MLLGARGHYTTKSTASASLKHRPGTAMVGRPWCLRFWRGQGD